MIQDVICAQCGAVCGSYDSGRISGPPEDCYPAEYVEEPPFWDDDENEFCSQECLDEYHAEEEEDQENV